MKNWCEKIFSLQHTNGKVIKELGDIVSKLITISIALKALQVASSGLAALKVIEKSFFAKDYAPFVVMAIMVYFLLWIFYAVLSDDRTIATLLPITLIYGFACVWSFGTMRILFPKSPNIAVINLVLWVIVYIVIVVIYCKKKQSSEVATNGSKQPLESTTAINGDGNAPEHPVMGPSTTEQMHVSRGDELRVVLPVMDQPTLMQQELVDCGNECVIVPPPALD